jgi:hypothetical protein
MSDEPGKPDESPPKKRGEAAWKEEKERIAERNARARKAGMERRQVYERQKAEGRQAVERRQMAQLAKRGDR